MVLTNAPSFDHVRNVVLRQKLDTIKIVTGWGLPWNDIKNNNRALICSLTPHTIVRTTNGDPSNAQSTKHPIPDKILAEIEPWYKCKRDIIVEIGNEPNMWSNDQDYIFTYRWFLNETIKEIRKTFPLAHIMSTALQPEREVKQWYDIFSQEEMNIYEKTDYVGVHAYEYISFFPGTIPSTNHYKKMVQLFEKYKSKLFFSELGINGNTKNKIEEYRLLSSTYPVTYYHYCFDRMIDSAYHIA